MAEIDNSGGNERVTERHCFEWIIMISDMCTVFWH